MNIGIIGSGNMGASMGKIWAAKGHKVLFSFSKDQEKLRAVAAAAGGLELIRRRVRGPAAVGAPRFAAPASAPRLRRPEALQRP